METVTYDAAGNVTAVRADTFTWDEVGRMVAASVIWSPSGTRRG